MEQIAELREIYTHWKASQLVSEHVPEARQAAIGWAIHRLELNQEESDDEIVLLAAAISGEDVFPTVESIVRRYCGRDTTDPQFVAGKYLVLLRRRYEDGLETVDSLEPKILRLYSRLKYPDWLVVLSRNCEYATDVSYFLDYFNSEFAYVAGLWSKASTLDDFFKSYNRAKSDEHSG